MIVVFEPVEQDRVGYSVTSSWLARMVFMANERASLLDHHRITEYLDRLARALPPAEGEK